LGAFIVMKSRYTVLPQASRQYVVVALLLAFVCLTALVGVRAIHAAASPASQCVGCHTDPAKLRALTPPDPPPTEEGEG
jgi:hypothetical protein